MMSTILTVFHVIFAVLLIILVLMQKGKSASMGSMVGMGGASQTLFGSRGSGSFMTKLTGIVFFCLVVTSLVGFLYTNSSLEDTTALFKDVESPAENIQKK